MRVIKIFAEERQEKILEMLKMKASLKVSDLSNIFNVSQTTIRRDLMELENKKLLTRTHGGAVKANELNVEQNYEASFVEKTIEKHDKKIEIGKKAASMINDGDNIILDSGTTTLEIARNITAVDLTVITNSIDIVDLLSNKKDINVIVTGGSLRPITRAMVGHIAENTFKQFRVDKVFIGANGISSDSGITTPNFVEAQTKKAMINSGGKIIVVADSSKFSKVSSSVICETRDVAFIVTDSDVKEDVADEFENLGVQVIKSQ